MIETNRIRASAAVLAVMLAGLLLLATKPADAAFSGTNGKIFFQTTRDGFTNIYSMNPNGSAPTELVGTDDGNAEKNPAVSPDGSRVAYERLSGIWVMNSNGTAPRTLTAPTVVIDTSAAWSPDGTRIAFVRGNSANRDIWVMNADGSGQRKLIGAPDTHEYDPAWSPKGDKIAFTRGNCDEPPGTAAECVFVQNADGSGTPTNLTPELNPNNERCDRLPGSGLYGASGQPAWSPDGLRIAFRSRPDCHEDNFAGTEIWVMSAANGADGSETNLTSDGEADKDPAFSPDGRFITFSSDRPRSDFEIYTIPSAGGSITQRTDTGSSVRDENPDWGVARPRCTKTVNAANDPLVGTAGNDVLCGDARNNTINGAGGDDIVLGEAGDDTLIGTSGKDTLNGGPGRDMASFAGSATAIKASLTTGFAQRVGTSPLEGVSLVGIENLTGSASADTLTGSTSVANALKGLGGSDELKVRDGFNNDAVDGGPGTDTCARDAGDAATNCP